MFVKYAITGYIGKCKGIYKMRESLNGLPSFGEPAQAVEHVGGVVSAEAFGVQTYDISGGLQVEELPGAELVSVGAGSVVANQSPGNCASCSNCNSSSGK
jgi:hypothetical protein